MKTLIETLDYQPLNLPFDELTLPEPSISSFFKDHPLHVTRALVAQFYECWINQNEDNLEGTDISLIEMMKFVGDLNHLINLSYIIGYNYDVLLGNVKDANKNVE